MTNASTPLDSPAAAQGDAGSPSDGDFHATGSLQRPNGATALMREAKLVARLLWVAAILTVVQAGFIVQSSGNASDALSMLVDSAISFILYVTLAQTVVLTVQLVSRIFLGPRPTVATETVASSELSRIAAVLEQIAADLKEAPRFLPSADPVIGLRGQSIARFEQALAGGDLTLSLAALETHIAEFPNDDVSHLQAQLAAARSREISKQMALLDAARQVNDPDRVLEIFNSLKMTLEDEPRQALERELARWFLSLVHRRLRSGTIQPDVVTLAQKVSDNFGSTVEGASLRAALPTMRRSVGLCPRCAQPYVGSADACPRCLTAPSTPNAPVPTMEADDPEFEDASFDDSDPEDLALNHLAIDDVDLDNLRLIDPELDDEAELDRRS